MKTRANRMPRFSIQSAKKSAIPSNLCSNSPNITSQHFTIHATEISENKLDNIEQSGLTSNKVPHSISEVPFKCLSRDLYNGRSSSVKKKIKMSEEISPKRVILILPNKSPSPSKPNSNNCDTKKNINNSIIEAKSCQSTTCLLDNISDKSGSNYKVEVPLTDSAMKLNTDERFYETSPSADLSINHNIIETVRKVYVPRYHSPLDNLSSLNSSASNNNNNSNEEVSLTSSSSERPSGPCQVERVNKLIELKSNESKDLSTMKVSTQVTVESFNPSALQKESKKIGEKSLTTSLASSSSIDKPNSIITKQLTYNSPFRQININGLTLRAIDPSILNDSKLKQKIEILNRSQLTATSKKPPFTKDISDSVVTTTTVETPRQINNKNDHCERCAPLHSEVNKQRHTIFQLKRDLMKLTTSRDFYSNIVKEMKDINTQLTEDLNRERDLNSKFKKGIETRDTHIKELEYELTQVSTMVTEMESKAI